MKDRRFVFVLPNDDDGAPVEVRGNNKFLRLSTSLAVSTVQREIRGDPLHRTGGLPPSLMGSFFWAGVGGDDDTENDDLLLPPCYPMLPLENYGQYANLLPKPAAPLVDVDPSFSFNSSQGRCRRPTSSTSSTPATGCSYSGTSATPSTRWRPASSSATRRRSSGRRCRAAAGPTTTVTAGLT
jgi:hypothetical protein